MRCCEIVRISWVYQRDPGDHGMDLVVQVLRLVNERTRNSFLDVRTGLLICRVIKFHPALLVT